MSEKTKAFMDRAKEQTIGCEIEMAEITRNTAIKVERDTSEHLKRFTTTAVHTTLGDARTHRAEFGR